MIAILEILKYTIPAIVVLIAAYLIVEKFLVTDLKRKQLALLHENQDITTRLRLQAYERLVLYIERIHPRQLVPRVYASNMNVAVLQSMLISTIRSEFEHNLSQQIYVSKQVWDTVKGVMEQEMGMINQLAGQLNPEAPAKELQMRIMDFVLTSEIALPTEVALDIINNEAKYMLFYGHDTK
ncbi:MAG: hypothetical protein EOP51_08725 [Sphingobacteriales bacterium]|nr:MAG: hypothetical protein EOP51_08725 [Sphingobacteriales bacterium]